MKKFAHKLFSKLVLGGLMMFLQFAWLVMLVYHATITSSLMDILLKILAVILAVHIANKDIKPYFKLSWIVLILFLPFLGCTCYFLFGRSDLTKRTRRKMQSRFDKMATLREKKEDVSSQLQELDPYAYKQSEYISNWAKFPAYYENDTTYFECGEKMFPAFLEDLKNAKKFIFLEYFIIAPGKMLDTVLDILEEKVKEGVEVRFIYDDIGSINNIPHRYYEMVSKRGIQCVCFNPFRPFLSVIMNNRDHRKILVVDGEIAYTGGINLADEYINEEKRFGYWKDTAVRITGEAVWNFTTMFLEMWDNIKGIEEDCEKYKAIFDKTVIPSSKQGFVQPYGDSPLDKEDVGEIIYLNLIQHAKKYVYIFTPYLIIGSEMQECLMNAAKAGVDVRIVVPGMPDKKMVYLLTEANFAPLIRAGVKIYQFNPGFLHAKCFVVDDQYATVGTVNLDYRSLYLHFECGAWMYQTACIPMIKKDMVNTMLQSHEVSLEDTKNRNGFVRLILLILNLFAPLL